MDYFSNDEEKINRTKNKRKSFLPIVFILVILLIAGIIYAIKDDVFSENYYGPGMTTEEKPKETTTTERNKNNSGAKNSEAEEEDVDASITSSLEDDAIATIASPSTYDELDLGVATSSFVSKNITTNNKEIDTLVFAGDIYFSKRNINAYDDGGVYKVLQKDYIDIIDDHDFFVANLECCLTDADEASNKEFTFKVSPKYVSILKDMHIDLVTVANNHAMDYGEKGFLETLDSLNKSGIDYYGGGKDENEATKPYVLEINGRKYALISATSVVPNVNWFANTERAGLNSGYYGNAVCNQIKAIKDKVDKVIVYIHWGVEKDTVSNEDQQTMGRKFVDFGADLVVGTHSHRLQEVEYYKNVPIVYGIGNFIFGSTWTDTEILSIGFDYTDNKKGKTKIKLLPGTCGYELTSVLSTEQKRNKFILDNIIPKSPTCILDDDGYIIKNPGLVE